MNLTEAQKAKVEDLLSQMTLEEKIGQMNLESPSIVGGFEVPFEELIEMMTDGRISQEEFQKIMASAEQDYHEDGIRAGKVGAMMAENCSRREQTGNSADHWIRCYSRFSQRLSDRDCRGRIF